MFEITGEGLGLMFKPRRRSGRVWVLVAAVACVLVFVSSGGASASAQGRFRWPGIHRVSAGYLLSRRVLLERVDARGRGRGVRGPGDRRDARPRRSARAAVVGGSRVAIVSVAAGETTSVKLALNGAERGMLKAGRGRLSARLTILQLEPEVLPAQVKTVSLALVTKAASLR
jgi:hypothetical protein